MGEGKDFGAVLRRERERRGVSLEDVAERTKIGLALLDGLERGDLRRWPSGIFRRAFIRAYADAIGLAPDEVAAEFERVCPTPGHDGLVPLAPIDRDAVAGESLRLRLASTPGERVRGWLVRAAAATADLAAVLTAGQLLSAGFGLTLAWAVVAAGAAYFGLGILLVETSPAMWGMRRSLRHRPAPAAAPVVEPGAPLEIPDAEPRRGDVPVRVHRERRHARGDRRRSQRPAARTP